MFCPTCGQQNQIGSSFCNRCGAGLPRTHASDIPHQPPTRKKSSLRFIGYFFGAAVILYVFFIVVFLFNQDKQKPKEDIAANPSPTPTPQMAPEEIIAQSRKVLASDYSKESYQEILKNLEEIPGNAKQRAEADRLKEKAATTYLSEEIAGPAPTTSPWDGKVYCVDRYLKGVLNDYDSAEYMQWSGPEKVKIKGVLYWRVRLKLRAANAFGAKIIKIYTFLIQNNTVVSATDD